MKRLACFLLAAAALLAVSCQEKEPAKVEKFSLDRTSVALQDGLEGSVDIFFTSENVTPTAATDDSWLDVEVFARAITVSYSRNETGAERTGKIIVTPGSLSPVEVTVKQPAYVAPPADAIKVGEKTADGKGMVFWVDNATGKIAKAISLERTTGKAWGAEEESEIAADSYVNGLANTKVLAAVTDAYPAAAWCAQLGDGWYLPARDEMTQLFDIYNGLSHSAETFKAAVPSSLSAAEQKARADFEKLLVDAGAAEKLNSAADNANGDSYWTSTSEGTTGAYYVRFGKYDCPYNGVKRTSTTRFVRCMKTIGNYVYPGEPVRMSLSASSLSFEGETGSQVVTATVKNGSVSSATVDADAASWCTVSPNGSAILISVAKNESGALRTATVTVTASGDASVPAVTAEIAVSQKAAGVEGFKLLEVYKEGGVAKGIVFWVSEDGLSAKVVSLKRLAGVAWSTEASGSAERYKFTKLGELSADDGSVNTIAIRANAKEAGITEKLPWLAFLDGLGEGWYLPADKELQSLAAAYYGVEYGKITAAVPSSLPAEQKAAVDAFEKLISDNGGDPVNAAEASGNGESIFSSTEVATSVKNAEEETVEAYTSAYYVRFGKLSRDKGTKDGTGRTFRGVKLIKK